MYKDIAFPYSPDIQMVGTRFFTTPSFWARRSRRAAALPSPCGSRGSCGAAKLLSLGEGYLNLPSGKLT